MPDTGTIRTKITAILRKVRARLISEDVFSEDEIWLSMKMSVPVNFQGDRWAIVVPLGERSDPRRDTGAGRANTVSDLRFDIYVRSRCALDVAYRDEVWLNDPDFGVLDKVHEVIDVLQMYNPVDENDRVMLEEPMRWIFSAEPKKDQYKEDIGFGERYAEFQCRYVMDLDQSWK